MSVAQVMTRGTVKSRLIPEREWAIRSQASTAIKREHTFCIMGQLMIDSLQTR